MRQIVFLALATAILVPSSSEATVLLSNLAEATRDTTPLSLEQWAAQAFTTDGGSYTLLSIDLVLGELIDAPTVVAQLHASGPSDVGAVLTTFNVPSIPTTSPSVLTLTPLSAITLAPNTTYWVVMGGLGQGSFGWSYAEGNNSIGPGSFGAYGYSGDAGLIWENFGVENPYKMEIEVAAIHGVPEPASVLLLLSGLAAAIASSSRRRSA
jgi:hypothetical protein